MPCPRCSAVVVGNMRQLQPSSNWGFVIPGLARAYGSLVSCMYTGVHRRGLRPRVHYCLLMLRLRGAPKRSVIGGLSYDLRAVAVFWSSIWIYRRQPMESSLGTLWPHLYLASNSPTRRRLRFWCKRALMPQATTRTGRSFWMNLGRGRRSVIAVQVGRLDTLHVELNVALKLESLIPSHHKLLKKRVHLLFRVFHFFSSLH
mmetsp:Transcript_27193/g.51777  ORF Transcript_27193/g.51777 Transcript_27193/m.51777 type:complete len:202 (-) Transcript_27193:1102-1707(-)